MNPFAARYVEEVLYPPHMPGVLGTTGMFDPQVLVRSHSSAINARSGMLLACLETQRLC